MIYTVTFNPAIDYVVFTDELVGGKTNRSKSEQIYVGGKGINVSAVLAELGIKSKALGFAAGFTGKAIEDGAAAMGVETDLIRLESGFSRINVKIKSVGSSDAETNQATKEETEINGRGPDIPEDALEQLYGKLDALRGGDTLVLAGSIPSSLPKNIYERILQRLSDRELRIVADASGELLLNVLKYKPFLIKPNRDELGELFGTEPKTDAEVIAYAKKLREMGAANVLVSLAGDGAILVDERGGVHRCGACKGAVKNSVGAGDSMVAGFLAGIFSGSGDENYEYALKLGTAAGGATAFSDELAKKDEILKLLEQL